MTIWLFCDVTIFNLRGILLFFINKLIMSIICVY